MILVEYSYLGKDNKWHKDYKEFSDRVKALRFIYACIKSDRLHFIDHNASMEDSKWLDARIY